MAQSLRVGEADVTILTIGHLQADLADWLRLPPPAWKPRYSDYFERPFLVPIQCMHIRLGATAVLVDAPGNDPPPLRLMPPDYQPPVDLLSQLWLAGLPPGAVEHVVITHPHFDHYGSVTVSQGKSWAPAFPNARYYLGQADWEQPALQRAIRRRGSEDSHTWGVLESGKRLEIVEGRREIAPGVAILPAPGETAGHQIVRVHSAGRTLYYLGDLYHHVVEVEQPGWVAHWCKKEATLASRAALVEAALAEDALLITAHIPGVGRLAQTAEGVRWEQVEG